MVSSRRRLEPCVRFSLTRLTDILHLVACTGLYGDRLAARYSLTWSSRTLPCSVLFAPEGIHQSFPPHHSTDEAGPLPIAAGSVDRAARAVLRAPPPPSRPDATSRGYRLYAPIASRTHVRRPGAGEGFPSSRTHHRDRSAPSTPEGSSPLHIQDLRGFHGLRRPRPARLPLVPRNRRAKLTGRQDSLHATDRTARTPPTGRLTLGSDAGRFPPTPPACYPAPWHLPGPDSHRQADASLCPDQIPEGITSERWAAMEPLWSPVVATGGNRSRIQRRPKPQEQAPARPTHPRIRGRLGLRTRRVPVVGHVVAGRLCLKVRMRGPVSSTRGALGPSPLCAR